jgi:hypothetical protein
MINKIEQIAFWVKALVGHEYLYFDKVLSVRTNPHAYPFNGWGVCVGPKGEVYVMDADEFWHQVEEGKTDEVIVDSLYQRVSLLRHKFTHA